MNSGDCSHTMCLSYSTQKIQGLNPAVKMWDLAGDWTRPRGSVDRSPIPNTLWVPHYHLTSAKQLSKFSLRKRRAEQSNKSNRMSHWKVSWESQELLRDLVNCTQGQGKRSIKDDSRWEGSATTALSKTWLQSRNIFPQMTFKCQLMIKTKSPSYYYF